MFGFKKIFAISVLSFFVHGCSTVNLSSNYLECSAPSALSSQACSNLVLANSAFERGDFGTAEKNFRISADILGKDAPGTSSHIEALLGLAASYDTMARFDLADPVYAQLSQLAPDEPEYLNNYGYSLLLRGDVKNAREYFERARVQSPENQVIMNNGQMAMNGQ